MGIFSGKRIGIVGGFGAYAGYNFLGRFLDSFQVETERDYPDVVMDNVYSMPSRTRCLLAGGGHEEIVEAITSSIEKMLHVYRVDCIVLVCGTAHYFLPDIYKRLPEAREKVVNILESTAAALHKQNIKQVLIMAAEGTLKHRLYAKAFATYGVEVVEPAEELWPTIRKFIEAVKQNKIDEAVQSEFMEFIASYNQQHVILGCTEFPVLVKNTGDMYKNFVFHDALEYAIYEIHDRLGKWHLNEGKSNGYLKSVRIG